MADTIHVSSAADIPAPWAVPLETLDVSRPELFLHDRHGDYFRRLREEDPVHFCPDSAFGPYWSITKFNDIIAVETNPSVFSSHRDIVIGDQEDEFYAPMFIAADPPVHDIQRKVAQQAVAPTQLYELQDLIRDRAETILDNLPVGEEINWVEHVSIELTTQMLAILFDMPFEDRHLLPYWSDAATDVPSVGAPDSSFEKRHQTLQACLEYFSRLWHERAAQPRKFDFISLLAHDPATSDMINEPMELLGNLMLLIVGGNDTTRNSISGGVVALNRYPGEYDKLRADPSLIPSMVSEIIRYQTPLYHMRRTATRDFEFRGKQIRKGDRVVLWYISGNRDEEVIEQPERFWIDRPNVRRHISFGFGIHRCMGNRVAEMQLRLLWEEIQKRFDRIELVGEPVRVQSNFVNGYTHLPVVVHTK